MQQEILICSQLKLQGALLMPLTNLKGVVLMRQKVIQKAQFSQSVHLLFAHIPETTLIRALAFQGCHNLRRVSSRSLEEIESEAFLGCLSLAQIDLSKVRRAENAFVHCSALVDVEMPLLKSVNCFRDCFGLLQVVAPSAEHVEFDRQAARVVVG